MISRSAPILDLLKFILAWVPDLRPEHRIPASSIPAFVPPPLRSIYELTGNYPIPYLQQWRSPRWIPGLFGKQDFLLPLDQLKVEHNRFRFVHENQGGWCCESLANANDPPVFSDACSADGSANEMREVCPTLSHFLTTFCLQELAFGSRHLFCVDSKPARACELVKTGINELWANGMYVYEGAIHSFYLCGDDLLIMNTSSKHDGEYWLACNEEPFELFDRKHDIRRIH
jgi:hypothetical protein